MYRAVDDRLGAILEEATMSKRREPAEPDGGGQVADECEAVLAGRWAEYRLARGRDVPPWAWLNRVAHADERALRYAVRVPAWSRHEMDEWDRMRFCVAQFLVQQAAEKGVTAAALQQSVLVPIELQLFGQEAMPPFTKAELLIRILAALRHPSSQFGPR
jgi:hypothetical protein